MERRSFLKGIGALIAAPALVKVSQIMPINSRLGLIHVTAEWHNVKLENGELFIDDMKQFGAPTYWERASVSLWIRPGDDMVLSPDFIKCTREGLDIDLSSTESRIANFVAYRACAAHPYISMPGPISTKL